MFLRRSSGNVATVPSLIFVQQWKLAPNVASRSNDVGEQMLFVYLIQMKCTKLTLVNFHIGEGFITNGIIIQLEHRKWKIYGKCQRGKMLIDPLILHC
jgi:hypothetical protein